MNNKITQYLSPGTPKRMLDGSIAYLTNNKNYFIRREPDVQKWKTIKYYSLDGNKIPLARAKCKKCEQVIESRSCGDYVSCECGASFVDTDRWSPERHRYGGEAEAVSP